MSNLLQSCQTTATQAPGYYNQYLQCLATKGLGAAGAAQYVGATPLQQEAFNQVCGAASAYKQPLQQAAGALGSAYGMATKCSPLAAGSPFLQGATACLGGRTQALMNPYVQCVVSKINTLGNLNIDQNLAPEATSAAVGSGQFGSQRGAQVLGQTIANADQQMLAQESQALQCGFKTAMCGALHQGALCAQAGATAGCLASRGAQNLTNIAKMGACMAITCQNAALARINALQNLGATQQTIAQNRQLFPLQTLCKAAQLLHGYQIPTSVQTTASVSPLGAAMGLGSTVAGLFCAKNGSTPASNLIGELQSGWNAIKGVFGGCTATASIPSSTTSLGCGFYNPLGYSAGSGGGCSLGNLSTCSFYNCKCLSALNLGFSGGFADGGSVGCASTKHRGALPRE